MPRKRDYAQETKWHATEEQKKRRAARNKARRRAIREGKAKKGDGTHVDHKDFNPLNNSRRNTQVVSKRQNLSKQPKTKRKA